MGYIIFRQRISSKSQSDPFPDAFAFSSNITLKKCTQKEIGVLSACAVYFRRSFGSYPGLPGPVFIPYRVLPSP